MLPWNEEELAHIQQIEDFINTYDELFEQEKSEEFNEYMEIYMSQIQQASANLYNFLVKVLIGCEEI